jgi:hypothetical protein
MNTEKRTGLLKQNVSSDGAYIVNSVYLNGEQLDDFIALLKANGIEPNCAQPTIANDNGSEIWGIPSAITIQYIDFVEIAVDYFRLPKRKTCEVLTMANIIAAPHAKITFELIQEIENEMR